MIILSGGQTGVDRAALDVALARSLDYGGWCPKGGWAEDFPEPPGVLARYPKLKETPLADPAQRTEWNVRDAHACLIVVDAAGLDVSPGTALAEELAYRHRRPVFVADLGNPESVQDAALWLRVQRGRHGDDLKLAIGGPRESEAPGTGRRQASSQRYWTKRPGGRCRGAVSPAPERSRPPARR
jgi:Circularly permutated YpsA SLOG family